MTVSDRETFLAIAGSGQVLRGDAIVILSGDGLMRLEPALQLFKMGAAQTFVVTGGLDNPPHSLTAEKMEAELIGKGLQPSRIIRLDGAKHTRAEAVQVVQYAIGQSWKRLLVVTSIHHQYRAFLAFVQALRDAGKADEIHVLMVPASQTRWSDKPVGMDVTRRELLRDEWQKIDEYRALGHVASYSEGVDYLLAWESKL